MELKDIELKDRKEQIKKELYKLLNKLIIVSKDEMDKFEGHEMKKIRPVTRNWFDRLIEQSVVGKKPKIIIDKLNEKIINDIWRLFDAEKEELKRRSKMEK